MDGPNHLAPAFGPMKDNRSTKFKRELQLALEYFTHPRRDLALLQPIQPDLPDSKPGFGPKSPADLTHSIIRIFDYSIISQRLPRMNADEVASNQEFADRRIAAGNMTMRIRHFPNRSFSAILIDSVAMPAVIFE